MLFRVWRAKKMRIKSITRTHRGARFRINGGSTCTCQNSIKFEKTKNGKLKKCVFVKMWHQNTYFWQLSTFSLWLATNSTHFFFSLKLILTSILLKKKIMTGGHIYFPARMESTCKKKINEGEDCLTQYAQCFKIKIQKIAHEKNELKFWKWKFRVGRHYWHDFFLLNWI